MSAIPERMSIKTATDTQYQVSKETKSIEVKSQTRIQEIAKDHLIAAANVAPSKSLKIHQFVLSVITFPIEKIRNYIKESAKIKLEIQEAAIQAVEILKIKDPKKKEGVTLALRKLMEAGTSKWKMQSALRRVNWTLRKAKVEAHVVEKNGNVRVVARRVGKSLGDGAFKKCWRAIQMGGSVRAAKPMRKDGKVVYFKEKVTYTPRWAGPRDLQDYHTEVVDSAKFSEILRKDDAPQRDLFLKYKSVTYKNGKKVQATLMADFAEGGHLRAQLKELKSNQRYLFCRQLLEAGKAMESAQLVHRDLKTENIFLKDGHIVIGDYGLMFKVGEFDQEVAGTPGYIPQKAKQETEEQQAYAQDRYAMGMILLEIVTKGKFDPFESLFNEIGSSHYCDPEKFEELVRQLDQKVPENPLAGLILKLLERDSSKRITLTQALAEFDALDLSAKQMKLKITQPL